MLKILIKKTAIIPVLILGIVSFCFGLDDFRNPFQLKNVVLNNYWVILAIYSHASPCF